MYRYTPNINVLPHTISLIKKYIDISYKLDIPPSPSNHSEHLSNCSALLHKGLKWECFIISLQRCDSDGNHQWILESSGGKPHWIPSDWILNFNSLVHKCRSNWTAGTKRANGPPDPLNITEREHRSQPRTEKLMFLFSEKQMKHSLIMMMSYSGCAVVLTAITMKITLGLKLCALIMQHWRKTLKDKRTSACWLKNECILI